MRQLEGGCSERRRTSVGQCASARSGQSLALGPAVLAPLSGPPGAAMVVQGVAGETVSELCDPIREMSNLT